MLHKTSYLSGFHLLAADGEIGHVDDFLVDEHWKVRYLIVDTRNGIGGRSVLIAPSAIDSVDAPNEKLHVKLSREEIKRSPSVESADIELIETLPAVLIF
jgi:uncharacterized protein YifN (PemK superfamily)